MALTKYILKEVSEGKRVVLAFEFLKVVTKRKSFTPEEKVKLEEEVINSVEFKPYMQTLLTYDPTPNSQYLQWLIRVGIPSQPQYMTEHRIPNLDWEIATFKIIYDFEDSKRTTFRKFKFQSLHEDMSRIREYIETHFNVKQRKDFPQQYKDINVFKSWDEFAEVMRPYVFDPSSASFEEILTRVEEGKDYVTLYDDAQWGLYQPETEMGACALGSKSEWCTAWGENSFNSKFKERDNHFDSYKSDTEVNDILTIHDKSKDTFYQIDLKSESYMDASDRSVNMRPLFDRFSEGALSVLYNFVSNFIEEVKDDLEMEKIENMQKKFPDSFSPIFEKIIDEYYRLYLTNKTYIVLDNGQYYAKFDDLTEFTENYCKTKFIEDSFDYFNGLYADYDLDNYKRYMTESTLNEILEAVVASDEYKTYESNVDEEEFEEPTTKNIISIIEENDEFKQIKKEISYAIDEVINDNLVSKINNKIINGSLESMGISIGRGVELFDTILKWGDGNVLLVSLDMKEGDPSSEIFINYCKQIIERVEDIEKFEVNTDYMSGSIDKDNASYMNERILERLGDL